MDNKKLQWYIYPTILGKIYQLEKQSIPIHKVLDIIIEDESCKRDLDLIKESFPDRWKEKLKGKITSRRHYKFSSNGRNEVIHWYWYPNIEKKIKSLTKMTPSRHYIINEIEKDPECKKESELIKSDYPGLYVNKINRKIQEFRASLKEEGVSLEKKKCDIPDSGTSKKLKKDSNEDNPEWRIEKKCSRKILSIEPNITLNEEQVRLLLEAYEKSWDLGHIFDLDSNDDNEENPWINKSGTWFLKSTENISIPDSQVHSLVKLVETSKRDIQ